MRVRFRCGCPSVEVGASVAPRCPRCGHTQVGRVFGAPAPRFVGHGKSPLIRSEALEPKVVDLAPGGPLIRPKGARKEQDAGTVRN